MIGQIDTKTIRTQYPLPQVLARYVDNVRWHGGDYVSACPFCGEGDDRFHLSAKWGHTFYHCRQCGQQGDVAQLIMTLQDLDYPGAVRYLQGEISPAPLTSGAIPAQRRSERLQVAETRAEWADKLAELCAVAYVRLYNGDTASARGALQYLADRGIGLLAISYFHIGYNEHWRTLPGGARVPPGITLPRFADDMTLTHCLVYLAKEARRPGQRRLPVAGSRPKLAMFNGWRISEADIVMVFEGELDAALAFSLSPASSGVVYVATGGAGNVPSEPGALADKRVIVVCDNDQAGRRCGERWRALLPDAVIVDAPAGHKDIGDYHQAGGDVGKWLGEMIGHDTKSQ